jgi:hypothetical protein
MKDIFKTRKKRYNIMFINLIMIAYSIIVGLLLLPLSFSPGIDAQKRKVISNNSAMAQLLLHCPSYFIDI